MSKKKILVVGGAGYIGSHVNKLLNEAGYETVVFDNLSTGNRKAVTRGLFIQGDMANLDDLERLFSTHKFDAVMHFAACIDVGESVLDPAKYYVNNVVNTLNLLQTMLRHHVKVFIFSSTAAIFGNPEQPEITEEHSCHPINPYGESKLMVEKILRDFDHAYGLKYCALRYFNAAGGDPDGEIPNLKKKESNLIPAVLRSLKNPSATITIFGDDYPTRDGTGVRDYIHIYDLGAAHITAMKQLLDGGNSACYNLGNGQGFSVKEVIESAEHVTGLKVNSKIGPRREGDPAILLANSAKATQALRWRPQYPELETMIRHAWTALQN